MGTRDLNTGERYAERLKEKCIFDVDQRAGVGDEAPWSLIPPLCISANCIKHKKV